MYIVKRYSVSRARECFADLLDEAERGVPVVIERRDVRFVLRAEPRSRSRLTGRSVIETLDPAIDDGQWQWGWTRKGVRLTARRRRT